MANPGAKQFPDGYHQAMRGIVDPGGLDIRGTLFFAQQQWRGHDRLLRVRSGGGAAAQTVEAVLTYVCIKRAVIFDGLPLAVIGGYSDCATSDFFAYLRARAGADIRPFCWCWQNDRWLPDVQRTGAVTGT